MLAVEISNRARTLTASQAATLIQAMGQRLRGGTPEAVLVEALRALLALPSTRRHKTRAPTFDPFAIAVLFYLAHYGWGLSKAAARARVCRSAGCSISTVKSATRRLDEGAAAALAALKP